MTTIPVWLYARLNKTFNYIVRFFYFGDRAKMSYFNWQLPLTLSKLTLLDHVRRSPYDVFFTTRGARVEISSRGWRCSRNGSLNIYKPVDQNKYLCISYRSRWDGSSGSTLFAILFFWCLTDILICNNGHVQIQRWKSPHKNRGLEQLNNNHVVRFVSK